jgi:3-dehydroquinate synthase
MKTLQVKLPDRSYNIDIGLDILKTQLLNFFLKKNSDLIVVVTNETLHNLYPNHLSRILSESGILVTTCVLPDGEQYKNLDILSKIFDFLMEVNANRQTLLIAFGGGVIGDMAGFAAATFVRGIPYIQVPTTLLANVDSSVGGKTAVNHPLGKNSIGSFKQPEYVCIELSFLKTLPSRELRAGYIELLKHGLIHDEELLDFIRSNSLEPLDFDFLEEAILRSCNIKGRIVEKDETETGIRATLNFGHTLGHLIETHAGFGKYLHGEAVGVGMFFASFVSWRCNEMMEDEWMRINNFLSQILTPIQLPALDQNQFKEMILHDKKSQKHSVNFIMLKKLGKSFIRKETPVEMLWNEFKEFTKKFPEIIKIEGR